MNQLKFAGIVNCVLRTRSNNMIELIQPKSKYRTCQCCHSSDGVIEISFVTKNNGLSQSSVIALCKKCRNELKNALSMQDGQSTGTELPGHSQWIDIDSMTYTWKIRCAKCGYERSMMSTGATYPSYCEGCGSRMDGE